MATASQAQAVKSLNKSPGRRRFVFKTFSQRIEDIDVDVFRSLDPLKSEPAEGSSFFRDCLVQWRELNTAEDFISFYEEMMPLVQTLPQIILQKELILSKLLSRLQIKGRLSLEPILRLIAALSRDLLEDFFPFLQRIADSLVLLLKTGADREPEIIEQIFTSWSYIMVYLQKYLVKDIVHALKVTVKLRYYPKGYVQEFVAESVSFLLRNAPVEQLIKGIRKVMLEAVRKPLTRKSGVGALLCCTMRGTSSRLHSRAAQVEVVFWYSGYQQMIQLVGLLVQTFVMPSSMVKAEDQSCKLTEKILQLMICLLEGLHLANNLSALPEVSLQWAPVFELRNSSLLTFLKELVLKDPCILHAFRISILRAFNDLIETSVEEVVYLLLTLCERLQVQCSSLLDGTSDNELSKIRSFFQDAIGYWIGTINDAIPEDPLCISFQESKLALLWGTVCCYPYIHAQQTPSSLMDLVDAIDRLMMIGSGSIRGFPKGTWQSIIGAVLNSYRIMQLRHQLGNTDFAVSKFLYFAKRYKSSSQILSTVADFLDSVHGSTIKLDTSCTESHGELETRMVVDSLEIFAENLCHPDKQIRLSTLRILCHYEPLNSNKSTKDQPPKEKMRYESSQACDADEKDSNFLQHLLSIEETPLSISTSRKVVLLISRIQMDLCAGRIPETYAPFALYGIIGILHNRFSSLWDPAIECLAVLIRQYFGMVWEIYVQYLEQCQTVFLASQDQIREGNTESPNDLVRCFRFFVTPVSDSTPHSTVLSWMIQTLQKLPTVAESRSREIIPLFLKFLGYSADNLTRVKSYSIMASKRKEWKIVLKEWLNLLTLMHNPKSFCRSQFLKEVLQYRLLDENDAELQMKVLDCLLNWKDDFLLPYDQHLKNLISSKNLREELTTWSLSRESKLIDGKHRPYLVPIIIRILVTKVRKVKTLASRKLASVHHRKAVLAFLAELDVGELPLFFALLIKPLQTISQGVDGTGDLIWSSPEMLKFEFETHTVLRHFSVDNLKALSWKKKYGFLHVIEDILGVFDESRINPFLDLLMGCVVRILVSCTSSVDSAKSCGSSLVEASPGSNSSALEKDARTENLIMTSMTVKQFKDMRSLCLKIISFVMSKYDDHAFGCEFWDLFFASVKPLIDGFKQEGASSEKPSSLFSCFLAMSKSCKLVSLLCREKKLIPDIFSILTVTTASEAIISSVLKFIENLLILDNELDTAVKGVLVPNLESLVCSLHHLFTCKNVTNRKLVKFPGERELVVFKLLSKYIKDPPAAKKFVDILLPLLSKRHQNSDECVETLHVIQHIIPVLGNECSGKILKTVSPLLISAGLDIRLSICNLLDTLSRNDNSAHSVVVLPVSVQLLCELNATSPLEMGGLDYDTILGAYGKLNIELFYTIPEEHALVILSQFVHDMSSEELILRHSAYRVLLLFVEFCGIVLEGEVKPDKGCWSGACIQRLINNFLLKHMGDAMNREASVQKVWIDLLREMVVKLPKVQNLKSYQALCSEDAEQDFFNNVVHLQAFEEAQLRRLMRHEALKGVNEALKGVNEAAIGRFGFTKHRRARALSRFRNVVSSGSLSEAITNKVFIPFLFNMLLDVQDGKGEHLRDASMDTIASISGCMEWEAYYALLMRCFREMALRQEKQKLLLRLICSILDHFHFFGGHSSHEAERTIVDASSPVTFAMTHSTLLSKCSSSTDVLDIRACLYQNILPKVQKLLTSDSDNVNVNISLAALKLLKLLPSDIIDSQLPSIIHRISNFLKNRLESSREEARSALAACLKELGLEYLQFVVKVLRATLKRGYELHVLGYTLNFILSKCLSKPISGKLDYCLEELLCIVENDIFGNVSEEKEVDKIASKMKETRKNKSFETLKLIAQSITFNTHALKLLLPVTVHLKKQLTPKVKWKLETMLNHIAAGIECNPSVNQTDLFIFTYGLIEDGITKKNRKVESSSFTRASKQDKDGVSSKITTSGRLIDTDPQCSHLITDFALGMLYNRLKNMKIHKKEEQLLAMLDPFISLLADCLSSKYDEIISSGIKCLSQLVRLPLPSLASEAERIKTSLLVIAQGSGNASTPLMQSCIRLLTVLLRSTSITLSSDQLHMLIQFPVFADLERNPSLIALSLLKAIVNRRLVVHEIYDIVTQVAELLVTSQVEPVRKKCSQILLQFLLDYRLSKKRLQQHLDFLLANLRYEHSTGREATLEMLHAIIIKFPQSVVDELSQTTFVHLVVCLANDQDNKVRSMTGAAIKLLIGRVSPQPLNSILQYSLSWYSGGKQHLWSAAAQVLGLLVEVMKERFQRNISSVLSVVRSILQSAGNAVTRRQLDLSSDGTVPFWKEAYYSLVMLEKILHQYPGLCTGGELEV
ncbi:hypothetical protein RJ640_013987 [Escallonia rubra]|uniref:Small subunit processome component 20 homolog n=1 Tax=Escallonia rubra TaxID=112253 RepID=A0AA88UNW8_9ASTE|nr:hypothetical protein RJ640_013987 [Escallonia rubra]